MGMESSTDHSLQQIPPQSPATNISPNATALFAESVAIMARLRGSDGCPWDREQSFDSIRKYTLEETYEVLDAIERRDWRNLAEELGDLLLQVLFYAQMASEKPSADGGFSIAEVLDGLNRKLIRRHPHVFGEEASRAAGNRANIDATATDSQSISATRVVANWDAIKRAENQAAAKSSGLPDGLLAGVLRSQPALSEAAQIGSKAAKAGFDWHDWRELLAKVAEETDELVAEVELVEKLLDEPECSRVRRAMEAELGDLLFTTAQLGRHLKVDPEMALRGANLRFRQRFGWMETEAAERDLASHSPEELEALWSAAKRELAETEIKILEQNR